MPTQTCWPELEPYGVDRVWDAIQQRAQAGPGGDEDRDDLDLLTPEWRAFTSDTATELSNCQYLWMRDLDYAASA